MLTPVNPRLRPGASWLSAATGGANRFGIRPAHKYNVANLLASDPTAHLWAADRFGSDIISTGLTVGLTASATSGGQAQYLKLIDTTESHANEPNNYASTDFDGDGMSNDWEIANGLNPQQNDANEDKDKDGMSNYEEFLAGTNPNDPASRLEVKNLSKAGEDIDLTWRSVAGQNYGIHFSNDLVTWQDLTDSNNTPPIFTADGAETTVHITMPEAAGAGRMFFRVELKR